MWFWYVESEEASTEDDIFGVVWLMDSYREVFKVLLSLIVVLEFILFFVLEVFSFDSLYFLLPIIYRFFLFVL